MVVFFVYSSAFCKQEKGKRAGYSAAQPFLVSSRNALGNAVLRDDT